MKENKKKLKIVELKTKNWVPFSMFTDRILTTKKWIYLWYQFNSKNFWWQIWFYHFYLIFDEKIDNNIIKKCINSWFNNYTLLWEISIKNFELSNINFYKLVNFNELLFQQNKKWC